MSAAHQLSAGEIAEIARSVADRRRFRDEVMERLQRNLGYEGGWFHTLDPSLPLATGAWLGLEMELVERARAGWQGYAPGLAPLLQASSAGGGVAVDAQVFSRQERERLAFYRDVARPLRIEPLLWTTLSVRSQEIAVIGLARRSAAARFSDAGVDLLRSLVAVLSVADGFFALPRPSVEAPIAAIGGLTRREREVADLVVLGYTNREIGIALGTSPRTVRNQMTSILEKTGAATRTELTRFILNR